MPSQDHAVPADYDGDNKADLAVFRNGEWYLQQSTAGSGVLTFGQAGDIPVQSDFDGDSKIDVAIYRNGAWWMRNSSNGQVVIVNFGVTTDVPVNGK